MPAGKQVDEDKNEPGCRMSIRLLLRRTLVRPYRCSAQGAGEQR